MNTEQNFAWTEKLVLEFMEYAETYMSWRIAFAEFKKSKQQSNKDWEIVEYSWAQNHVNEVERQIIKSVKRLSDGEVFTSGSNTGTGSKIESLDIIDGSLVVSLSDITGTWKSNIASLSKATRKPLFKTEDGKDIYEGDAYWYINYDSPNPNWKPLAAEADKQHEFLCPIGRKQFSSIQATRDYIILNEPVLSFSDVISICSISDMGGFRQLHAGTLKKLAQSKITKP